jgi:quinol-cytochrome oxidoreductase complex cytochrome b subunit
MSLSPPAPRRTPAWILSATLFVAGCIGLAALGATP